MIAGDGRAHEEVDSAMVVEIVDLQPRAGARKFPSKRVDEDAFTVLMHLHQRCGKIEPLFGKDEFYFHRKDQWRFLERRTSPVVTGAVQWSGPCKVGDNGR